MESFSDAAIRGARGNSGIIFAQYLNGLSVEMPDQAEVDYNHYALASQRAVQYAYDSIESPVEGTILSVMRAWGDALSEEETPFAVGRVNKVLSETQYQLMELRRAKVVDAGAKGFTLFIQGISDYFKYGEKIEVNLADLEEINQIKIEVDHDIHSEITYRYCTECLLEGETIDASNIKESLTRFGDSLVVAGNKRLTRIHLHTNDPQRAFEVLHHKGRITYQKVDDMKKQQDIVLRRKSDIALLTDSIADLPQDFIDQEQIHVIHLNILFRETSFIDKITITPKRLLAYSKDDDQLPTSSQPDEKQIENILSYLSSYYKSLIIITVSQKLSGTHNTIKRVAQKMDLKEFKISVIDSKQNSGAQGLLVTKAAELIGSGLSHHEVVSEINKSIPKSKILVKVKNLDNMIKSGRLSTTMGKIGKRIGLKPVVTLDEHGDGGLSGIAFTERGSLNQVKKHIKKKLKHNTIESYSIVHVNNLEEANTVAEVFTKLIGQKPKYMMETSSVIAVGAGDQAIALSYILGEDIYK